MSSKSAQFVRAKQIHEKARFFRGHFRNSVAVIERELGIILTEYFCAPDADKQKLFFDRVVSSHFYSLRNKKEILVKILKADYPQYWKANSNIFSDLDDIMEFRNKLAHSIVDATETALNRPIEQGIGFVANGAMDRITMPSALLSCLLLIPLRGQESRQKQVVIGHRGRSRKQYGSRASAS
jgi:hypothetical protein